MVVGEEKKTNFTFKAMLRWASLAEKSFGAKPESLSSSLRSHKVKGELTRGSCLTSIWALWHVPLCVHICARMHVYVYRNTKKRWGTAKHLRKTGPGQTAHYQRNVDRGGGTTGRKESIRWAAINLLTTWIHGRLQALFCVILFSKFVITDGLYVRSPWAQNGAESRGREMPHWTQSSWSSSGTTTQRQTHCSFLCGCYFPNLFRFAH